MKNIFVFQTKIGIVAIEDNGTEITDVNVISENHSIEVNETSLLKNAALQLNEYLEGKRNSFDLPLNPNGTEFQKKVWAALCDIPYGETRSYKQIAEYIGNPKACRAVGMANNKNPIMIFIPCHRVVGSDGSLTGYAGGLDMKEKLLSLEKGKAI
ncbi:MAG: methylated-DNA--[protein]-cysteine S-methyltransferase [Sedimentibacter saalensis]|jgi:methylated-DNA-[protein]-cysteine S-methyltransferase|uniref:methylated-DNA--[protein]-cysteine S-methyltransferase n=1 Tax=Sedimentibacter saalensis TaxID=130788 RepID=UPI002B20B3B3|nr:methylated-DNA--[protein]-cysteine S-methyltransferase [Sedimentibacter saalensis]MEA5093408.1 methylated-DNA--[protein]-cysteine S-methyltransferase [Sedimentibacter saalensis]